VLNSGSSHIVNVALLSAEIGDAENWGSMLATIKGLRILPTTTKDSAVKVWNADDPDILIVRRDSSGNFENLIADVIDESTKSKGCLVLLISPKDLVDVPVSNSQINVDHILVDPVDVATLQREVKLLARIARSENAMEHTQYIFDALKESEDKYRTIVESLEDGYFEVDKRGQFTFCNRAMLDILDLSAKDVGTNTYRDILSEASADKIQSLFTRVHQYNVSHRGDIWEIVTKNGHTRTVEASILPIEVNGKVAGFRGIARDVTHQREFQREMERKDERFRAAIENTKEAFFLLESVRDTDSNIVDFIFLDSNRSGLSLIGATYDELIGSLVSKIFPYLIQDKLFDKFKIVVERREMKDEEIRIDLGDSNVRFIHHTIVPVGDGVAITAKEVTEEKMAAQRVVEDRNLLNTIINAIPDEIYVKDKDRRFLLVNQGVVKVLKKKSIDEVIGKLDVDLIKKDSLVQAEAQDRQVLDTGTPLVNFEGFAYTDESQTDILRSTLISKFPYYDKDGNIIGLIGINRDITDRKRAEIRIKRSLREKEVLLKEIHHRVKNNLAVISGLLFMQAENMDSEEMKQVLLDSEGRIRSMAMIHEKLYHHDMYSGIEFGSYVKDLVRTISTSYQSNGTAITVTFDVPPTYIDLNRAMPCALIVNEALTNAYKHAFKGRSSGSIHIQFLQQHGSYKLMVKDDGVGMSDKIDPAAASTLGMVLMHGLSRQLGSEMQISRDDGTQLKFEFGGDEKAPY